MKKELRRDRRKEKVTQQKRRSGGPGTEDRRGGRGGSPLLPSFSKAVSPHSVFDVLQQAEMCTGGEECVCVCLCEWDWGGHEKANLMSFGSADKKRHSWTDGNDESLLLSPTTYTHHKHAHTRTLVKVSLFLSHPPTHTHTYCRMCLYRQTHSSTFPLTV